MDTKTYAALTGVIFALVSIAHLYRLINGTPVTFGDWEVPMWVSYIGVVVAGYLAYESYKLKKRG